MEVCATKYMCQAYRADTDFQHALRNSRFLCHPRASVLKFLPPNSPLISNNNMISSLFPYKSPSTFASQQPAEPGTNIFGKTSEQIAQEKPEYAFTELINLNFPQGIQLELDTTNEGRIWASTVKTYLEQDGVGQVWWGRKDEERDAVQLVIGRLSAQLHLCF